MGETARLPSGCRDSARREATFPAPRFVAGKEASMRKQWLYSSRR